jgi:hypothetical protein
VKSPCGDRSMRLRGRAAGAVGITVPPVSR